MHTKPHAPEMKNLILAVVLSTTVLLGWQYLVEEPKRKVAIERAQIQKAKAKEEAEKAAALGIPPKVEPSREDRIAGSKRVSINTEAVQGSVNLTGFRIDDLTLAKYKESLEVDAHGVVLLSPAGDASAYFAEFGWLAGTQGVKVPTVNTVWQSDQSQLSSDKPLVAHWDNGEGLRFEQQLKAEDTYLFQVEQKVTNRSDKPVTLYPYGLISRTYKDDKTKYYLVHEGPLGVYNQELVDVTYETLRKDGKQTFTNTKGWFGVTDKYWLTAIVPSQKDEFSASVNHFSGDGKDKYQTDYRGAAITLAPGETAAVTSHFFAGAKEVSLLDYYGEKLGILLFDRSVDFGSLYFLTKPIFLMLTGFHQLLGNFGLAILMLTVTIKLLLFPLANKSYRSMNQIKLLMPRITEIRERSGDDKIRMNQEIMDLYKREKVNPASGCLPLLIQLPVFFALYKVLFVTIEMRQASFYGWIKDLSVADPTNVFNLFGLIDWAPPAMFHIGAWPLIMCATMVIQQRLSPAPNDPVQAAMMKWMPVFFLVMFSSMPAGLIIYWAWNNTLSILQQWVITRR